MNESPAQRSGCIYLTGFMGSGKSTIGPILANTLGYQFLDLDAAIEAATGKTVSAIFRDEGEKHFRDLERETLREASTRTGVVVALGGGAMTDKGSLAIIRASGILIYIELPLEEILTRLRHKRDRPLIATDDGLPLDEESLRRRVTALFAERQLLYRQSDIIVRPAGGKLGQTVDGIVKKLAPYLPR